MSVVKSAVTNAASEKQIKKAEVKGKDKRRRELSDIRSVLSSAPGRRLLWRFMEKCGTFQSIWEGSAKIHYNAGQQDLGHFIMAEIVEADENLLFKMMKEAKGEN